MSFTVKVLALANGSKYQHQRHMCRQRCPWVFRPVVVFKIKALFKSTFEKRKSMEDLLNSSGSVLNVLGKAA
jgi:hypothetical protein